MSLGDDDEDSLGAYLKEKNSDANMSMTINEDEFEEDKKEEEEIFQRYERIGSLTDIKSIKESNLVKNYDSQGDKYYNEYKCEKVLGKGSYSKVKLVTKDGIRYAMKIIDKKLLKNKKIFKQDKDGNIIVTNLLKDALKEIAILKKLDHPNIIKLYEIIHDHKKQKIYLILEYAEYGDIVNYDEENGIFTINKHVEDLYKLRDSGLSMVKSIDNKIYYDENDIRHFIKQILLGLDYLHKNGIIHHDIKPNNILLCRKKICKITDFNFSSILENLNEDNIGSNGDSADHFKAPETIHFNDDSIDGNQKYEGKPLDIWAFGVTFYILTYLKLPFDSDEGVLELYRIIKEEKVNFPKEPYYTQKIKYLINKCLEKDPKKRKTADEILKALIVQKREILDLYKSVFVKKVRSIFDLPNDELVLGLDFITDKCKAVFEDPNDKSKPILVKVEKKYINYDIPEDRISREALDKIIPKSLWKSQVEDKNKIMMKIEKYIQENRKKNNNNINNNKKVEDKKGSDFISDLSKKINEIIIKENNKKENNFMPNLSKNVNEIIIKEDNKKGNNFMSNLSKKVKEITNEENNKKENNFLSNLSKKVNEIAYKDNDNKEKNEIIVETTTITKEIVIEGNELEGKSALKKYINEK